MRSRSGDSQIRLARASPVFIRLACSKSLPAYLVNIFIISSPVFTGFLSFLSSWLRTRTKPRQLFASEPNLTDRLSILLGIYPDGRVPYAAAGGEESHLRADIAHRTSTASMTESSDRTGSVTRIAWRFQPSM